MLLRRAAVPTAVFSVAIVLNKSAAAPNAVLLDPELKRSVPAPTPVLKPPSVLLKSEYQPTAVFAEPVVRLKRAWSPSAVLNPDKAVSGAAVTFSGAACAVSKSGKQQISSGMRSEAHCQDAWFVEFLRFVLNDVSVLRIIFFIVCGFSRTHGFLGIRRITYECSCPALPFAVKKADRKTPCPSQISAAWKH